jgi:hypothetical protein
MTIGTALVIIAVLYLIDRHNLWKRAAQGLLGLVLLTVLVVGGWYGVSEYQTWHLGRDIKTAQSLGLCAAETPVLPPPAGYVLDHPRVPVPWVPVFTQDNHARCVDADKVSLEVPPNRIVLSPKDIAIWKVIIADGSIEPNAPHPNSMTFDSTPLQHDTPASAWQSLESCVADGKGGCSSTYIFVPDPDCVAVRGVPCKWVDKQKGLWEKPITVLEEKNQCFHRTDKDWYWYHDTCVSSLPK